MMSSIRPRSVAEYLQIFWHRKGTLFSVFAVVLASTFIAILKLPDVYESRSLILAATDQSTMQSYSGQIAAVTQQINSRSVLEPLVRRYNLYGPERDLEEAVSRLRTSISLETKMRADVYPATPMSFALTLRYSEPQTAQKVMTELVSVFERANESAAKQLANEVEMLTSELLDVESRLNNERLARTSATELDTKSIDTRRTTLTSSLEDLSDKQYALEHQIVEQKRQIAEQQKLVKSIPAVDPSRTTSSYGVLLVRKAELEAQLSEYATQYTEKNPKVIQTRSQLNEINRQMARFESEGGAQGAAAANPEARELRQMEKDLARMETDLEVARRELQRKTEALADMPATQSKALVQDAGAPSDDTQAETFRLRDRYSRLGERRDSLQRVLSGGSPALFEVVDPPSLPMSAIAPNRRRLRLLSLVLAAVTALVVVASVEVRRLFVIQDDRDVGYYLGVPVVALIPETVGIAAQPGRRAMARIARAFGVVLLIAALVPGLVFLLNRLQIFEILAK